MKDQYGEVDDGLLHRRPTPSGEQLKSHGDHGTPTTRRPGEGTDGTAAGDP
jgi:hypothetical protein